MLVNTCPCARGGANFIKKVFEFRGRSGAYGQHETFPAARFDQTLIQTHDFQAGYGLLSVHDQDRLAFPDPGQEFAQVVSGI